MTRLADITRLDRLGLPVWQAVRPMSRALSVHQGKGATVADAQLGALVEAIESHSAETFAGDGPLCRFDQLPEAERAPHLADFGWDRANPPGDRPHRWAAAENLLTGGGFWLPFDLVSLDLTRDLESPFERTSNGVGAGATRDEAIAVALRELVERDAVSHWARGGLIACARSTLEVESVPYGWFRQWLAKLDEADILSRFFAAPSLAGLPVFVCELNDLKKDGQPFRISEGRGCHPLPEIALFKALAEALQGRLTFIAGARDDLLPSAYQERDAARLGFAIPLSSRERGVAWGEVAEGPADVASMAERLATSGYGPLALVDLAAYEGLNVVRAFACGLGSLHRQRREARP